MDDIRQDARDDASRSRINIFVRFMPPDQRAAYEMGRAEWMKERAVNAARDHVAYNWAPCPPYGLDVEYHELYREEFARARMGRRAVS